MDCTIERSKKGAYYTLTVDGQFAGNYDTAGEAAREYDRMVAEKERESA